MAMHQHEVEAREVGRARLIAMLDKARADLERQPIDSWVSIQIDYDSIRYWSEDEMLVHEPTGGYTLTRKMPPPSGPAKPTTKRITGPILGELVGE